MVIDKFAGTISAERLSLIVGGFVEPTEADISAVFMEVRWRRATMEEHERRGCAWDDDDEDDFSECDRCGLDILDCECD